MAVLLLLTKQLNSTANLHDQFSFISSAKTLIFPLSVSTSKLGHYRSQYLQIGQSSGSTNIQVYLGEGSGSGPALQKYDFGTGQATVNVLSAGGSQSASNFGSSSAPNTAAVYILGSHASNAIYVTKGTVAIGILPGETATVLTLGMGYRLCH